MHLPETIVVRYTEEEAEYVSLRPVVHQQFRGFELVDMILSVTGKDLTRIQRILRSGTVVFHSYRYWWRGFDADPADLREILSNFPDPDFSRPFRPEACTEVILESGGALASHSLRFRRDQASKRRFLRSRSFWDSLMHFASEAEPAYREYSYAERADLYSAPVDREQVLQLAAEASRYATRSVSSDSLTVASFSQIVYACPR